MWTLVAIPAALAPAPTTIRSWSLGAVSCVGREGPGLGDDEAVLGGAEGDRGSASPARARDSTGSSSTSSSTVRTTRFISCSA